MTLDQLRYFVAVSELQHIGQAARILHISPSAISHAVRELEESLGIELLRKNGKRIACTDAGILFAQRARAMLDQAESLKKEFRSRDLPLEGLLRVVATHGLGSQRVAPALARLTREHPGLTFELLCERSARVVELVAGGFVDLGVCFSPLPHPAITVHHRESTPLVVAMRPGHPLLRARRAPVTRLVESLSSLPAVSPKSFAGIEICEDHPALQRLGIRTNTAWVCDSYEAAAGILRVSEGWGLIPESLVQGLGLALLKVPGLVAEASIAVLGPKGRSIPEVVLRELSEAKLKSSHP